MNPGKITQTFGQLSNLRLGTSYNPLSPKTHFHNLNDDNKRIFSRAVLRCCVGVDNLRNTNGGTMCPYYISGNA